MIESTRNFGVSSVTQIFEKGRQNVVTTFNDVSKRVDRFVSSTDKLLLNKIRNSYDFLSDSLTLLNGLGNLHLPSARSLRRTCGVIAVASLLMLSGVVACGANAPEVVDVGGVRTNIVVVAPPEIQTPVAQALERYQKNGECKPNGDGKLKIVVRSVDGLASHENLLGSTNLANEVRVDSDAGQKPAVDFHEITHACPQEIKFEPQPIELKSREMINGEVIENSKIVNFAGARGFVLITLSDENIPDVYKTTSLEEATTALLTKVEYPQSDEPMEYQILRQNLEFVLKKRGISPSQLDNLHRSSDLGAILQLIVGSDKSLTLKQQVQVLDLYEKYFSGNNFQDDMSLEVSYQLFIQNINEILGKQGVKTNQDLYVVSYSKNPISSADKDENQIVKMHVFCLGLNRGESAENSDLYLSMNGNS